MDTTQHNITLGHSHLQGVWATIQGSDGDKSSTARIYPDRRLSVCHGGCDDNTTAAGRTPGRPSASNSDSLLGSLLAESFVGAVFGPLLPLWAQAVDWSSLADGVDTLWQDRREAYSRPSAPVSTRFSYLFKRPLI